MSSNTSAALSAYRSLFRATRRVFRGDNTRLVAARSSIRQGFRRNATLEPTSPECAAQVKHAEEVAAILRHNVVQGKKEGDTYKLRIHEDTERGDNESIKFAGNASGAKCCSS